VHGHPVAVSLRVGHADTGEHPGTGVLGPGRQPPIERHTVDDKGVNRRPPHMDRDAAGGVEHRGAHRVLGQGRRQIELAKRVRGEFARAVIRQANAGMLFHQQRAQPGARGGPRRF
jgi:hypothetical protein